MQTTKHTPGPWAVDGPVASSMSPSRHILSKGCGYPAHVFGGSEAEADANARLVAATPDLFEACRAALAYLQATNPLEHGNPALGKVWGLLESALKQATKA